MNQAQFIHAHEQQWLILEVLLNPQLKQELTQELTQESKKHWFKAWHKKRSGRKKKITPTSPNEEKIMALSPALIIKADFPDLYRDVCQHLSLAQSRRYSPYLIERLSFLIDRAHQVFYRPGHIHGQSAAGSLLTFFTRIFPQTVRNESHWLWLSSAVFYLPLLLMIVLIQLWPEFVYSVMSPDTVAGMEAMYDPQAEHIGRERGSDSDSKMFGFYIFNNTGIGFRTFATGLLFGIGSLFTLMFNGLHIGAAAGHLTQIG
ncbi:MAG: stage II sporulation protein M, partial [Gammaproteobacteria bacterium]|nr:stage II sporulation protein M [Gammaproteobacteria bacterium]